jgi:hypothetical protein
MGPFSLNDCELDRQVLTIPIRRPCLVGDFCVKKAFVAHHVSKDFLEATQRLAFQGPSQAQVSAVCPEPFAEFLPSGRRQVNLLRADDLYARNDVMSFHWYAANTTQLSALLAAEHERTRQQHTSGNTEYE